MPTSRRGFIKALIPLAAVPLISTERKEKKKEPPQLDIKGTDPLSCISDRVTDFNQALREYLEGDDE